jgi:signal transduction histidine kinase
MVTEIAMIFEQERRPQTIHLALALSEGAWVEGGAGQLRQVLWNLLRNAVEAMPEGGRIHVSVEIQAVGQDQDEVQLTVRDSGVGIAKADMDHIFEPFFSRKPEGTGLGLATTARIVEEHKGTIEVRSEPQQGTTFVLRFPRAR